MVGGEGVSRPVHRRIRIQTCGLRNLQSKVGDDLPRNGAVQCPGRFIDSGDSAGGS